MEKLFLQGDRMGHHCPLFSATVCSIMAKGRPGLAYSSARFDNSVNIILQSLIDMITI